MTFSSFLYQNNWNSVMDCICAIQSPYVTSMVAYVDYMADWNLN